MQVFRVFQTGVDELFELAVDFWHKLGEGKLLGERKLEETEQKKKKKIKRDKSRRNPLCDSTQKIKLKRQHTMRLFTLMSDPDVTC